MRKIYAVCAFALCLTLCGCAKEYSRSFFAMDTVMEFKIYTDNEDAPKSAEDVIKRIDALLDRGGENSEIYKLNLEKSAELSEETADLIKTSVDISEMTDGAFDVTTAPLSDLWGFYGGSFRVPSDGEIQAALDGVGYEKIEIDGNKITIPDNTAIDLGGIGKGYASDYSVRALKNTGVKSAVISLGGNVHALGARPDGKPWSVGITDPTDKSNLLGSVSVTDKAVVTSGGYQRYFEQDGMVYHHIIDPKTGKSARSSLASVTVISDSGVLADGLSTALFVMGLDEAAGLWRESDNFEAVFVDADGKIYITEGITDNFKCDRNYEIIKKRS